MTPLVPIMLFGWIPLVLTLFAVLPGRRAVIVAFLSAWLFLPVAEYKIQYIPEYNKMSATCIGVLAAAMIFDSARVLRYRPRWVDIPVLVLCLCPIASSLSNGLGLYDGISAAFSHTVRWGLPYFIGRIYFNDVGMLRDLAIAILIGGLIYVPFCLFEIRMSPVLHHIVYGISKWSSQRYGGWRPSVFMENGLALGFWMSAVALVGVWLWQTRSFQSLLGFPVVIPTALLLVVALLCKSTGALVLLVLGGMTLISMKWLHTRHLPIVLLAAFCVLYVVVRPTGAWSGRIMLDITRATVGEERASSLETRLRNEDSLGQKAKWRPVFGWGGWGRSRIFTEEGRDISLADGLWIMEFGMHGIVGLAALLGTLLLPSLLLPWRVHPRLWMHPLVAPTVCCAVLLPLWMIDNLFNAMANPIFLLMAGGLGGLLPVAVRARIPQARQVAAKRVQVLP